MSGLLMLNTFWSGPNMKNVSVCRACIYLQMIYFHTFFLSVNLLPHVIDSLKNQSPMDVLGPSFNTSSAAELFSVLSQSRLKDFQFFSPNRPVVRLCCSLMFLLNSCCKSLGEGWRWKGKWQPPNVSCWRVKSLFSLARVSWNSIFTSRVNPVGCHFLSHLCFCHV